MTVDRVSINSYALKGNFLKDPSEREILIWTPSDYSQNSKQKLPVIYALAGFMGTNYSFENWSPFKESLSNRLDRLYQKKLIGPCMVVMPDCFTSLGGNQYINSTAVGHYGDFINKDLVPFIDKEFNTLPHKQHRGCFGKSSGGYGSMMMAVNYPQNWGSIVSHSGDSYFDFLYRLDWPNTLNELSRFRINNANQSQIDGLKEGRDDGRIDAFLKKIKNKNKLSHGESHALMNIAMAAFYDPDPDTELGFRVPFNLDTGELIEGRWKNWLSFDPIHLVASHKHNFDKLKLFFFDCGSRDQYYIHFGARRLHEICNENNIAHEYQEFDDTHSGIDYRLDVSLPKLYEAIR